MSWLAKLRCCPCVCAHTTVPACIRAHAAVPTCIRTHAAVPACIHTHAAVPRTSTGQIGTSSMLAAGLAVVGGCVRAATMAGTAARSNPLSGHIQQTFDLLVLPRLIPLRRFCTVPTVQLLVFERIDIAECAGISKVKFDDTVVVVEWCAWVWPQRRILVEGH